jgi:hypothetical protein
MFRHIGFLLGGKNKMRICDAHTHIGVDYFYYKIKKYSEFNFSLKKLIKLMDKNGIERSIVMQCPSIKEITCCALGDLKRNGNKIEVICPECKKKIASLTQDPYRKYNLSIYNEIKKLKTKRVIPFFIVHSQNPFLREELEYYNTNFSGFGIKLHSFVSKKSISEISHSFLGFNFPILMHSGTGKESNPQEIIEFSKKYGGKVLMAHAARISPKYLSQISKIPNLFVDVSPLTSFYTRILKDDFKDILNSKNNLSIIKNPGDIYHYILKFCDYRKVLFGTDVPWCDKFGLGYQKEVEILKKLKLDRKIKESIAYKNFNSFLGEFR